MANPLCRSALGRTFDPHGEGLSQKSGDGRRSLMNELDEGERFADEILPHLDAAYNPARWLVRNADDADDIVQDAYLRAFRHFDGFRGGDARAWLLRIV